MSLTKIQFLLNLLNWLRECSQKFYKAFQRSKLEKFAYKFCEKKCWKMSLKNVNLCCLMEFMPHPIVFIMTEMTPLFSCWRNYKSWNYIPILWKYKVAKKPFTFMERIWNLLNAGQKKSENLKWLMFLQVSILYLH